MADPRLAGTRSQAAASLSNRQLELSRRLFGTPQEDNVVAPENIDRLLITVHRATNLSYPCITWKAPQCVVSLGNIYKCTPRGSAYGENPVWDWRTELRHFGKERCLVFEVRNFTEVLGVCYLPLAPLRLAGEMRKAMPLMHNGRLSGLGGDPGELQELFVTVRCVVSADIPPQIGREAQSEQVRRLRLARARQLCAQVRVTIESVKIDLTNNTTDVCAVDLKPYVRVSAGKEHEKQTVTAFLPHDVDAEEFVYQYEERCTMGGFIRGRFERYEAPPIPAPTGSQARPGYRKRVDGDLKLLYRDVKFVFWYTDQEAMNLDVVNDLLVLDDEDLVGATVTFQELFRLAYAGEGDLPAYARTGLVTAPLTTIDMPVTAASEDQVVGEISFECEFFQDPIACPSLFEGLWRKIGSLDDQRAARHQEALAVLDPVVSSAASPDMLEGVRLEVCVALADTVVNAMILNNRRVIVHEDDGRLLQERSSAAVQDLVRALRVSRQHADTLDRSSRASIAPVSLQVSAESYRRRCTDAGVNPIRPIVGLVNALASSRTGYGGVLHCAIQEAAHAIGRAAPVGETRFDGQNVFGLIDRYITISAPPSQDYGKVQPSCLSMARVFELARDPNPGEEQTPDDEKSDQAQRGRAALSAFLPEIELSKLCSGETHPGDKVVLKKQTKGTRLTSALSMATLAGFAGGLGVASTAKMIHKIDDDFFCNPKYQTGTGINKAICTLMHGTNIDEVCANVLATRKGFVTFFWIYWFCFFEGTYTRLGTRFSRVRELALEPTGPSLSRHAVICASGFLNARSDIYTPWEVDASNPWTYGQVYCLRFETELLLRAGANFKASLAKAANISMNAFFIAIALTNPVSLAHQMLTMIQDEFDQIWDVLNKRAMEAGKQLANALLATAFAEADQRDAEELDQEDDVEAAAEVVRRARPVSLVGFSYGASIMIGVLRELHRISGSIDPRAPVAENLICDVCIIGAPIGCSKDEWTNLRRLASGRFINGYLRSDKELIEKQFRAGFFGHAMFAGCNSLHAIPGIENKPMDELCANHGNYVLQMPVILSQIFGSTQA